MTEIPYELRGAGEVQTTRTSDGALELRHRWFPNAPRWTFAVLMTGATGIIMFFGGLPSSWEAAAAEGGAPAFSAYPIAALCYNSTTMNVTPDSLRCSHGPLPRKPGAQIPKQEMTGSAYGKVRKTVSMDER